MTRALVSTAPSGTDGGLAPDARPAWLAGAGHALASQVLLGLVGLLTLPVLGRQLGPAAYGDFSLFVTLLAAVTYQDVARQLLIHEHAHERHAPGDLEALSRLSTTWILALATLVGACVLTPPSAAALALVALFHGLASRDYATLSVRGRVGVATATRNFAWAAAFVLVALLSLGTRSTLAQTLPFVAAAVAIRVLYRELVGAERTASSVTQAPGRWLARRCGWAHARNSERWPAYKRAALDLLGFTLASSAIAALDRILLDKTVGGDELGLYCGAADVALRVHVVSSAVSAALYPALATTLSKHGYEAAARHWVRIASYGVATYFVGFVALLVFGERLLQALLGPAFAASWPVFALLVVGLFVHSFGFLLTPWQRAQGDFGTQRRAYGRAALAMLLVGSLTVPLYGAIGAALAYLVARLAEVQLVIREVRRLPRGLLPAGRLIAAATMVVALGALALWRIHGA